MDYQKEIESLRKNIEDVKKSLPSKNSLFGKVASEIGNNNSDTVIKTLGTVRIKYGNKYVTIFKDGKLLSDNASKFIYKTDKIGSKDGIYIIENEDDFSIHVVLNGIPYVIKLGEDTYVSFYKQLNTTSEQKENALKNIGFLFSDLKSIESSEIINSIVYVLSEEKLYIVKNGIPYEFKIEIPNSYETLNVSDLNVNNLKLKGEDINQVILDIVTPLIDSKLLDIIDKPIKDLDFSNVNLIFPEFSYDLPESSDITNWINGLGEFGLYIINYNGNSETIRGVGGTLTLLKINDVIYASIITASILQINGVKHPCNISLSFLINNSVIDHIKFSII